MRHRITLGLATAAVLSALAAFVLLGFVPWAYRSVKLTAAAPDARNQDAQSRLHSTQAYSASQVNGWKVIPILAAPLVGSGYLLYGIVRRRDTAPSNRWRFRSTVGK